MEHTSFLPDVPEMLGTEDVGEIDGIEPYDILEARYPVWGYNSAGEAYYLAPTSGHQATVVAIIVEQLRRSPQDKRLSGAVVVHDGYEFPLGAFVKRPEFQALAQKDMRLEKGRSKIERERNRTREVVMLVVFGLLCGSIAIQTCQTLSSKDHGKSVDGSSSSPSSEK